MPDSEKGPSTKICERLETYCQQCVATGSTDCLTHGGEPSALGKRPEGVSFDDLCAEAWGKQGAGGLKGVTKASSKRKKEASTSVAPAPAPLAINTLVDQRGLEPPEEVDELGGVRYRRKLKKYVVEYRPSRFKWKLWMGTYSTAREGRRACDCAKFYASQEKGVYYYSDSPALFAALGPLNTRPFSKVNKEVRDKLFNLELKKRAKQVIKKDLDTQKAKQAAAPPPPSCISVDQAMHDENLDCVDQLFADQIQSSTQEASPRTPDSLTTTDLFHFFIPDADAASSPDADLFADLGPLPHQPPDRHIYELMYETDHSQQPPPCLGDSVFVLSFDMSTNHADAGSSAGIRSSLDYMGDDLEDEFHDPELWNH